MAASPFDALLLDPKDGSAQPFIQTRFAEGWSRISPDGRWVAYRSDESGRPEIYLTPFPAADRKWLVSTAGGALPRWSRSGNEVYYVAPDDRLMGASVNARGAEMEVGRVQALFPIPPRPGAVSGYGGWRYDVGSDGRFLVDVPDEPTTASAMTVVLNWAAGRFPR
jgi:Tol biopolymer transport system component